MARSDQRPARVRRVGPEAVADVSAVLAEAFDGYPFTGWTVAADRHRDRLTGLFQLTVERVGVPYGEVWAADGADGRIAGAAVWLWPDREIPAPVWAGLAPMEAEYAGDRRAAMELAGTISAELRPDSPHLVLATVGVRPSARGRGIGPALLAPALAEADRTGTPAYLETSAPANLDFYRRLGFAVRARAQIPGGPQVWAMHRPPAVPPTAT
ncbi:GNAT family N-acetyltransferase [Polymorphospora lycopeni]|uniref:GNAT family N-acetyltransferase n=1 Tax=Polymorphospora lycopeni TaxID=3140240 RepID=A0ABV5CMU4_9ACTN